MSNYVVSHFGPEVSRIYFASLQGNQLTLSEVRRFESQVIQDKNTVQWNVPALYQELLEALRSIETLDEPVDGISCSSFGSDYLVFQEDGTLLMPVYHSADPRAMEGRRDVLRSMSESALYQETGVHPRPGNTLYQLASESKRLRSASYVLPVADAFNYLLCGVARVERSLAATTQLYDPVAGAWSSRLLMSLKVPGKVLPPVVNAGTELGTLKPEISSSNCLAGARVIAGCSHELAAAVAGLPVNHSQTWAFIRPGKRTLMGTLLQKPVINSSSEALEFNNQIGLGGVCFHGEAPGLWILDECKRFWRENNSEMDSDLLGHLASSAPAFVSLIDPANPMFSEPGDMVSKIQAFCNDTRQVIPRKPGPIYRCILESLALHYRRVFNDLQQVSGKRVGRLYLFGAGGNTLLNYFIANALNLPAVVCTTDSVAVGNVITQALALRHVQTLQQASEIVQNSFKVTPIFPQGKAWEDAFKRFMTLQVEQEQVA